MGIIFLLVFIAFLISAIVTNHNFTKRKLAFIGLSTSFALTIIPCIVSGISAKYPSDGDALGGGFLMLFAIFMAVLLWLSLVVIVLKCHYRILCYAFAIIMSACFAFNYFSVGFYDKILLLLTANAVYHIISAILIEKAKSMPMKIIAVISAILVPLIISIWIFR